MPVKKKITETSEVQSGGPGVWVTIEPHSGHTDEEIANMLRESGAEDVTVLAPGFVSALAGREALQSLADIANVNVKQKKQMRPV